MSQKFTSGNLKLTPKRGRSVGHSSDIAQPKEIENAYNAIVQLIHLYGIADITVEDYDEFLGNLLLTLGNTGTSARGDYPQSIDYVTGPTDARVATSIPLQEIIDVLGVPLRRWARFYATTTFNLARAEGVVFEWGRKRGIKKVAIGFDFADYVRDPEFRQDDLECIRVAKSAALKKGDLVSDVRSANMWASGEQSEED